MAGKNAKTERNDEIRHLYFSGVSQPKLAIQFNLTQCRISAIIHNKKAPLYRYCRYCNDRVNSWTTVCRPCRARRLQVRETLRKAKAEEKMVAKNKARANFVDAFKKRELAATRKDFIKRLRRAVKKRAQDERLSRAAGKKLRMDEVRKYITDGWQLQGRERVRFMVRVRDDFTCADCGFRRTPQEVKEYNSKLTGRKGQMKSLDVHHTHGMCGTRSKKYDKVADMDLMITLCHKCHFNRHDHTLNLERIAQQLFVRHAQQT